MTIRIKKIRSQDIVNKIGNICLYAFLFLTTYIFLYRYDHTMFLIRYAFLIVGALVGYAKCFRGRNRFSNVPVFAFMMSILWIIASWGQNGYENYGVSDFIYTICYIGICILVLQNEYSHIISLGLYGITAITILIRVLQGVNKNLILLANSRNFISILLLSTMLLYYISCHDKKKPILVTPVLLYFYINVYATGRSGIIVSGFLTLGLLIYKYLSIENKNIRRLMGLAIVIVLLTVGFYVAVWDGYLIESFLRRNFSAFFTRGMDSNGRDEIWGTFLKNNGKSVLNFLFGSDSSLAMNDGNLHNSFLQSYASFGMIGFVVIIVLVVRAFATGIKEKDYLWLILFSCLVLRAVTDRVFFQGYCEMYLYYFLFYYSYHKKCRVNNQNRLKGENYA